MTRRLIASVAVLAALALTALADDDKPQKKTAAEQNAERAADLPKSNYVANGDKPVGVIPDVVFRDEKRQKDIAMTIEYPIAAGSWPLIVWSHGFGGSDRGYVGLSSFWASHGYVVIKPAHADAGKLKSVRSADEIWESQNPGDWKDRVQDVVFILDSIAKIEDRFPELKGKIDTAHVGVGGHSYGAFTAMLLGGAKTFPGGTSYADPRVKVVVAMSPQGPGEQRGLTTESYASLGVPVLFMTGTEDKGVGENETPAWRRKAFELSPAGDKWLVVLNGATHMTFAGRVGGMLDPAQVGGSDIAFPDYDPTIDPRLRGGYVSPNANVRRAPPRDPFLTDRAIFSRVKAISVAFFDAYLHGNSRGKEFLDKLAGRKNVELVKK